MSRVGQNLMETPTTPGAEPPVHGAYLLTGRAGSFLYMSPEVIMCQPYNEKVTQAPSFHVSFHAQTKVIASILYHFIPWDIPRVTFTSFIAEIFSVWTSLPDFCCKLLDVPRAGVDVLVYEAVPLSAWLEHAMPA